MTHFRKSCFEEFRNITIPDKKQIEVFDLLTISGDCCWLLCDLDQTNCEFFGPEDIKKPETENIKHIFGTDCDFFEDWKEL